MDKQELIEFMKSTALEAVWYGILSKEEIIEEVDELLEDEDFADEISVEDIVDGEIARHRSDAASWPAETDFDRLDKAFRVLSERDITPRHHFTCCGKCGAAEIVTEMQGDAERGNPPKGFVFYHEEDAEYARINGELGFYFGAADFQAPDSAFVEIGQQVASALADQGFQVQWNNTPDARITVTFDWKRRWGTSTDFALARDFEPHCDEHNLMARHGLI